VADRADELHLGGRPAQACAGQREGRGVRVDAQVVGRDAARERRADAVEHRVAAGQHAGRAVGVGDQLLDQRPDR
jgi:hypothetical protein